jgi:thioredoxin-related protein
MFFFFLAACADDDEEEEEEEESDLRTFSPASRYLFPLCFCPSC